MRGPKSTYTIQLSQEEAKHLQQVVQAHKTPQAHVVRAKIVFTVHEHPDWSAPQIAQASQGSRPHGAHMAHALADHPLSG
jgi:hypothetical protein